MRNTTYQSHRRVRIKPRFFLVLAAFFALLAVGFFALSNAQVGRTIPPVNPIEQSSQTAQTDPQQPAENPGSQESDPSGSFQPGTVTPVVPHGGVDDPDADVLPLELLRVSVTGAPIVMLDPGHGGSDGGAYYNNMKESDLDLAVSLYVREYLQGAGITVLMTRETDIMPGEGKQLTGLYYRAQLANDSNVTCFVSIHANAFTSKNAETQQSVYGITTEFNSGTNADSSALAGYVQDETCKLVGYTQGAGDRGLFTDTGLVVTRETKAPSCLIEIGYLTCDKEFANLADTEYRKKLAIGIANGVLKFLIKEGYASSVE